MSDKKENAKKVRILLHHPRKLGDGKLFQEYKPGFHHVDEAVMDHYYTQQLVKDGVISLSASLKDESGAGAGAELEKLRSENAKLKAAHEELKGQHAELEKAHSKAQDELKAAHELLDDDKKGKKK